MHRLTRHLTFRVGAHPQRCYSETPVLLQEFHHGRRCLASTSDSSSPPESTIWEYPSVVNVNPLAESLRLQVREFTRREALKLVGILASPVGSPYRHDSEIYAENIQENCEQDGIQFELWKVSNNCGSSTGGDPSPENILKIQQQIETANEREDVDGILIFYPIYKQRLAKGPYKDQITGVYYKTHDDYFRDLVLPIKDVEGLCGTKWLGVQETTQLPSDHLQLYPCTALSVLWIVEEYHIHRQQKKDFQSMCRYSEIHMPSDEWKDQTVSVINRSEIMGRPLAVMMARKGATVYSIDVDSILQFLPTGRMHRCNPAETSLETCLASSNVVVSGVPDANFQLPLDHIRDGSTIISVSEYPNVCETTLLEQRPDICYVPQVGKVTVAVLENNLVHLKEMAQRYSST